MSLDRSAASPDRAPAGAGNSHTPGRAAGVSAIKVPRNSRPGTCLPSTTRQTVSGVARSSPSGPHSHVQKATDDEERDLETPAAPAYSTFPAPCS